MLVTFSPTTWYRLHNSFFGRSVVLDVVNDNGEDSSGKLQMADVGNYSGQYWQLRPHPSNDGSYTLCSWFLGPEKTLGFDNHTLDVELQASGRSTAQKWRIMPWLHEIREGSGRWDGTYKLVSAEDRWSGREICLDTYCNTRGLYVGIGNHQGKHWTITPMEKIDGRAIEFLSDSAM